MTTATPGAELAGDVIPAPSDRQGPPAIPPTDIPPTGVPPTDATPAEPRPTRRRRLRLLLAMLLGILLLALALFGAWYLLFRKPITQLPLPNLEQGVMPGFSFAAYDLDKPLGIAVSADGSRIYVTQTGGGQETVVLDSRGNRVGELKPPTEVSARASQLYVAVDPMTGDVYATDRTAGRVYVYTADGTYRGVLAPTPDPGAWQPLGIAFDQHGNVYVSDAGGAFQSVRKLDRAGNVVLTIGAEGMLSFPNGIAVDPAGDIYVTDSNNGRLLVFDATGTKLGLVQRGPASGELSLPRGIAIDDQNHVYVVDAVGQGVQVYRPIGQGDLAPRYVNKFGTEGTVDGAFEFPNGIAVDSRGRIYVADWNNDRIQVWSY
jgi:DNA-binding beta-propeller fold protein YncE